MCACVPRLHVIIQLHMQVHVYGLYVHDGYGAAYVNGVALECIMVAGVCDSLPRSVE